jgi:hypothetical protein
MPGAWMIAEKQWRTMPPEVRLGGCPCGAYNTIDGGNDVLVLWHLQHVAMPYFASLHRAARRT